MFAGKTTRLLWSIERQVCGLHRRVLLVSSTIDTREGPDAIVTPHSPFVSIEHAHRAVLDRIDSVKVRRLADIPVEAIAAADVIGIDEAQFFEDLVEFVIDWAERQGRDVVVSGLQSDFRRRPFGRIPELMHYADTVSMLRALCACGADAMFTRRTNVASDVLEVGGEDKYRAVCRECYHSREDPTG